MTKKNIETELNYVVGHEARLLARAEAGVLQDEDIALLRHYENRCKKLVNLQQYQEHRDNVKPYFKASLNRIRRVNDRGCI